MQTQNAIDLLVLGLDDDIVIEAIERQKMYMKEPGMKPEEVQMHQDLINHLIIGLDRTYGDGSYGRYINTGVLPSQQ